MTHTISVPGSVVQPPSAPLITSSEAPESFPVVTNVRANKVYSQRGGAAINVLSILAQFGSSGRTPSTVYRKPALECALISPMGTDATGRALLHELEAEGIRTRFCKLHPAGIPVAFVLRSDESSSRTVINHNPLPELSHEDFISILGPILVPEHYQGLQLSHHWHPHPSLPQTPPVHAVYGPGPGVPPVIAPANPAGGVSGAMAPQPVALPNQPLPPTTPGLPFNPPFTVFHITGRSHQADAISLLNLTGVDGLARDRFWRDKATFSLDCTAPVPNEQARIAREQLFKHVDVIFFSKSYALSVNPTTPAHKLTPRAFLLSQAQLVAPHALLLVHWDHDGGALLSVPTREYLQSSVWTDGRPVQHTQPTVPHPAIASAPVTVSSMPAQAAPPVHPPTDVRPETQLSLGSEDPRYKEFSTMSTVTGARALGNHHSNTRSLPDWSNAAPLSPTTTDDHHRATPQSVIDIRNDPIAPNVGEGNMFDYGFTADAFENVTPDSSWDYRANRTAVIYDSGDESESDPAILRGGAGRGLGLQTDMRMGVGPSAVLISEGIALSPSDIDSDLDVAIAAGASRFVMEERMRRVYGPMEHDPVESDILDLDSLEQHAPVHGEDDLEEDSDATESGQGHIARPPGPTRIGKLKKEKMRLKEEQALELVRNELEEEERAFGQLEEMDKEDSKSVVSEAPKVSKPLPPLPLGVVEAWQAGLLFALTRHVLPGKPYCPNIPPPRNASKAEQSKAKKPDILDSDWAWKWRLDECLRFAAEVAGRRALKGTPEGLARDMEESGWFS